MNPESDFPKTDSALHSLSAHTVGGPQQLCHWLNPEEASGWLEGLEQTAKPPATPSDFFEWRDEYSVEIGVFDEHHRHIFQLLNRLHEAIHLEQGHAALGSLLDELIAHVRWHFAAEELLMQAFAFPEALTHELEHERQLRVLLEFREQFADGREQLVPMLLEYMGSWLIRHILTTDRHYAAFFAARGATP